MSKIPTIAMIPSAYKANKVYSVLPTSGDADLDFARTGTSGVPNATRVNKVGLIEDVNSDVPRLDYSDGGCPTLLLEPQSTNLITYSENFSDASWSKLAGTITSNIQISPKGNLTADRFTDDGLNSQHRIRKDVTISSSGDYTISFFVKKTTTLFSIYPQGSATAFAIFNLDNLSITKTGGTDYLDSGIVDYGNNWFRCYVSFSSDTGTCLTHIYLTNAETGAGAESPTYTGNGSFIDLWGAQLEQLSYATSYIPTSGATATRVAETLSKTGLSDYINSSEGVLYFEGSSLANDGTNRYVTLNDGTANNRVCFLLGGNTNQIRFLVFNGTTQYDYSTTSINPLSNFKIALKYKASGFSVWINGVEVNTQNSGNTFSANTLNSLSFNLGNGTLPFYGKAKDLRVYNQALTDTELQNLTS